MGKQVLKHFLNSALFFSVLSRWLDSCEIKQTCFLEGCRRDGFLAKVKGFDLDALHAGEHYGKASIPLLVLPRRVGARATGCHCKEEQTNSKSLMIKFFRCWKRHQDVCCVSNAFSQSDLAARSLGVKKVFESNSFNFEFISVLKPLKKVMQNPW